MDTAFWGWNRIWLDPAQEPVGLGASIARSGPSEDSFDRICRPIAQLWDKKPVKNGPLRPLRSRRSPSPTGSWALLVNPCHVKNVSGRKSDVLDCQWLQQLMTCGLLRGAFRPAEQVCVLRSLWRQRGMLLRSQARDVQNRQKTLTQRNIQLAKGIADVVGETGQKILRAIVAGERDGLVLGAMKNVRSHASVGKIAKSLQGNWRAEHLFALKQALGAFGFVATQLCACDPEIVAQLQRLQLHDGEPAKGKKRGRARNAPKFDLRTQLFKMCGVDFTHLDGIDMTTALAVISETGADISRCPTDGHFASWMGLCPGAKITGG